MLDLCFCFTFFLPLIRLDATACCPYGSFLLNFCLNAYRKDWEKLALEVLSVQPASVAQTQCTVFSSGSRARPGVVKWVIRGLRSTFPLASGMFL